MSGIPENKVKPSFEIHFTTQTIKEIEDKAKKGLFAILNMERPEDITVTTIALLVEKSARVSEQEANKMIDSYLKEGGDFMTLVAWVIEKFKNSGFLGQPQEVEKAQKEAEQKLAQENTSSLQSTGKA